MTSADLIPSQGLRRVGCRGGKKGNSYQLPADCQPNERSRRSGSRFATVTGRKKGNKSHEEPMREHLYEKIGVDLTAVESVSIQAFLSEVGNDLESLPPRNTSHPEWGCAPTTGSPADGSTSTPERSKTVSQKLPASWQSIARARTKRTLSSPTGRTTRLRLAPGPRGSLIRVE
jgi:hypothetical protein